MVSLPKRRWIEMGWQDFQAGDTASWIAVLPTAAVEQHGPHLPVGVDTFIMEGYLARVVEQLPADLPVTILPVQAVGKSNEHLEFPGTLTLSAETAIRAWTEIGQSVARAGVRKLVIVNSHGGNVAVIDAVARELRVTLGMLVVTASFHRFGYPEDAFSAHERVHGIHAGDAETSLMLAFRPDTVSMGKAEDFVPATVAMEQRYKWLRAGTPAGFGWMSQDLHPSGAMGNAAIATREKGERAADHGAAAFIELLQDVARFPLDQLKPGPLRG